MDQQPQAPTEAPAPTLAQPTTPAASATPPTSPAPASKSSKVGIIIVVVITLILAGVGWFGYSYYMNQAKPAPKQTVENTQPSPTAEPSPTVGAVKSGDTQLDAESDAIDNTIDKANSDVTDVDKSLNDQPDNLN